MGRVGFDPRFFPPLIGMACHPCLTLRATSLSRRIPGRDDLGPPVVPGGQGIGLDPERSREWVGDWGGPETVWALLCVAERRATRPNGEWGYSTRRHMLGPEHPEAVSPERGVVLPDFHSHLLIVNKPQYSPSLCPTWTMFFKAGVRSAIRTIRQSLPNGSIFENVKGLHPSSLLLRYCSLSPAPRHLSHSQ